MLSQISGEKKLEHSNALIRRMFPPLTALSFGMSPRKWPTSIVVLARDEERCIARCLDSVACRGFDNILVFDAGSIDKTANIVNGYRDAGVRLIQTRWANSFADMRNLAIETVGSGWIIFLDADEWLTDASAKQLSSCLAALSAIDNSSNAVFAPIIFDVDRNEYSDQIPRIFRADSKIRYRGPVHEYPVISGVVDTPVHLVSLDILFMHDGYKQTIFAGKRKMERNLSLLNIARATDPDNPRWLYFTIRDGLPVLDGKQVVNLCTSLKNLMDREIATGDRRSARAYYRHALCLACQSLAYERDWYTVDYYCAQMDQIDQCASPDAHYFRSLFELLNGVVTDRDLRRTIERRRDDKGLSNSTLCPRGRHLDAIIAALLELRRSKVEADRYLEFCDPWNDIFFQHSRLRNVTHRATTYGLTQPVPGFGWRPRSASDVHGAHIENRRRWNQPYASRLLRGLSETILR
jgi:glycosyltransferase involved in cell wall biosynthesis